MADDETGTFDVSIDDVSPAEFAALLGGLGQVVITAIRLDQQGLAAGAGARAEQVGAFSNRVMHENPEVTRATLLAGDRFLQVQHLDADLLDRLDLAVIDGEVVDARDMTDVEVE